MTYNTRPCNQWRGQELFGEVNQGAEFFSRDQAERTGFKGTCKVTCFYNVCTQALKTAA